MEGIRVSGTFADIYNQIDAKNGFEELQLQNERKFEIPEHQEFKEAYNWNKENRIFYYFTDNCMNEIENNCDSEEDVYNYLIQNGGEEKWGLSDDEYKDVCNSIAPRIMDLMYDLDDSFEELQLQNERKFEVPEHQRLKEYQIDGPGGLANHFFRVFKDNYMSELESCKTKSEIYDFIKPLGRDFGIEDEYWEQVCEEITPRIYKLLYEVDDRYMY